MVNPILEADYEPERNSTSCCSFLCGLFNCRAVQVVIDVCLYIRQGLERLAVSIRDAVLICFRRVVTCDPGPFNSVSLDTVLEGRDAIAEHEVVPASLSSCSAVIADSCPADAHGLETGIISSGAGKSELTQGSDSYPVIQGKSKLSNEATDLIANSLGASWEVVADKLGILESDKNMLRSFYLDNDEQKHLITQLHPPGYVALVIRMLEIAFSMGKTVDDILFVLRDHQPKVRAHLSKESYFSLEECAREAHSLRYCQLPKELGRIGRRWDSYIVLIWIKESDKVNDNPLPNSISRPVRQSAIDWARFNANKLVVLCYSGSALNPVNNDQVVIDDFKATVSGEGLDNLILLDVDCAEWPRGDHSLYMQKGVSEQLKDFLPPVKSDSLYFSALIDCLRVVLVLYGQSVISSILLQQGASHLIADVPDLGAAFDVDYAPIPFRTFRHPYRPFCRDGTFDDVKYVQGIRMIVKDVLPNSMLALSHASPYLLRDFPTRENFQFFTRAAIEKPYLFAVTKIFRMRDVEYTESGQRVDWLREKTWGPGFEDQQIENRGGPLAPAAIPEYLPPYLEKYCDDPMAPSEGCFRETEN